MSNPHEIIVVRNHDELSRIRVHLIYRANIIAVQEEGGTYTILKNRYNLTYIETAVILDNFVNNQNNFDETIFGSTEDRSRIKISIDDQFDDVDWVKEGF